jgi:predicted MFS family arabinose efflux permease
LADTNHDTAGRNRSATHWIVFGAAFVVLLGAAGQRSAPSVLIDPLREEFGWSRATVGFAVSINVLLYGFIGPFAAALQQRYGLRRVTTVALAIIAVGAALTTQMSQPWHLFLLWGLVVGMGTGCMATVFASSVASRWFVERRGLVVGVLTAAGASGQLVFLPLLTHLADTVGWRWVGATVAIGAAAVIPVVVLFLRNRPEDVGLVPYGAAEGWAPPPAMVGSPVSAAFGALRSAWGSGTFWLLWGSFAVCGLSTTGLVQTHFISAAHDHGISSTHAGTLLALIGVFDVIGTIFSGWLTDRYDPRVLLLAYYLLRGLSLFVLDPALANGGGGLFGFMAFYGLDWVATVPPTIALCIRHFGRDRGPMVYGWVFAGHQVGGALAAWGAGELHDVTGSYRAAFVIAGACCVVAAIGVLRIGEPQVQVEPGAGTTAPVASRSWSDDSSRR